MALRMLKGLVGSKKLVMVSSFLGLYLLVTGASWAFFSFISESDRSGEDNLGKREIGEGLPKTESCPINGELFSVPEREIWESRRPILAIIENHHDSRPPSGISSADVVYEAVAEGGITRFLSVFYCDVASGGVNIAPVRSVRVYFIDWASEYGNQPIFMHVGGANDFGGTGQTVREARALELLETIGWRYARGNDFDTTYDSGFPVFWRNYERLKKDVATEHTMMASIDEAYKQAQKRGFEYEDSKGVAWDSNFIPWKFKEDNPLGTPKTSEISLAFWERSNLVDLYKVKWIYDQSDNNYLRENGGEKHIDLETGNQIAVKNVVVLFLRERPSVDALAHVLYTTTGEGDALIFQNGDIIDATWVKKTRTDRTRYFDKSGQEIELVAGKIWVEVLPVGNKVDY
jgi:hypothetical protein